MSAFGLAGKISWACYNVLIVFNGLYSYNEKMTLEVQFVLLLLFGPEDNPPIMHVTQVSNSYHCT